MRKRIAFLGLALTLTTLAGLSVPRAEAACFRYCCPDTPTRCVTCCHPGFCPDLNCP
ncbi:MAG: hypothetical protein ABIS20_00780 [Thermoanaerobaculia bacterium]